VKKIVARTTILFLAKLHTAGKKGKRPLAAGATRCCCAQKGGRHLQGKGEDKIFSETGQKSRVTSCFFPVAMIE
jgi:hypothetical protein